MRKISGPALMVIGLLHSLALVMPGLISFSGIWQEIGDAGVIDAVRVESLALVRETILLLNNRLNSSLQNCLRDIPFHKVEVGDV